MEHGRSKLLVFFASPHVSPTRPSVGYVFCRELSRSFGRPVAAQIDIPGEYTPRSRCHLSFSRLRRTFDYRSS